ncbi:MAG: hypothetical protein NT062_24140, partial [Proteobacteria bacterium]|nr:hypothetical protein [Pseudomonadota bacterium]
MDRDRERGRSSARAAEADAGAWPGKTSRIDREATGQSAYGAGPTDPGKRARTDAYAVPSTGGSLYGAFLAAYGSTAGGGGGAHGAAPAATPRAPGAVRAEDFAVAGWTAGHNPPPLRIGSPPGDCMSIAVQSDGIAASASVRALTEPAQHYAVGFVQTIHRSERRALYADGAGAITNQWLASRGQMLDQLTEIASPVPWYNSSLAFAGTAPQTPRMSDNPIVIVPEYDPAGVGMLKRMEGGESFTTYLVAMRGNDASTIVYLGNVDWNVSWAGHFNESYSSYDGGNSHVGGAAPATSGNAVLAGPAANDGPGGGFLGGPPPAPAAAARHRGAHAYAWGTYGYAGPAQHYADPPGVGPAAETDEQRNTRLREAIVAP